MRYGWDKQGHLVEWNDQLQAFYCDVCEGQVDARPLTMEPRVSNRKPEAKE